MLCGVSAARSLSRRRVEYNPPSLESTGGTHTRPDERDTALQRAKLRRLVWCRRVMCVECAHDGESRAGSRPARSCDV